MSAGHLAEILGRYHGPDVDNVNKLAREIQRAGILVPGPGSGETLSLQGLWIASMMAKVRLRLPVFHSTWDMDSWELFDRILTEHGDTDPEADISWWYEARAEWREAATNPARRTRR